MFSDAGLIIAFVAGLLILWIGGTLLLAFGMAMWELVKLWRSERVRIKAYEEVRRREGAVEAIAQERDECGHE